MAWICPTVGRPHRLAELAESWVRFAPSVPLHVRVWEGDPLKNEYFKREWPKEFRLYEGPDQFVGPTLNRFFDEHGFEDSYGFIGDDVLLATPEGLQHLEALAYPFFLAYPNDTIQRHNKPTHFCVGGELARRLGWVIPPGINQMFVDDAIGAIAASYGLMRYAPQVVFFHKHPFAGRAEDDDTYRIAYSDTKKGVLETPLGRADLKVFRQFMDQMGAAVNAKIAPMLLEVEGIQLQDAGYAEESPLRDSSSEPIQTSGIDSGGVGGRDSAGGSQEPGWDVGGIQGNGPADEIATTVFSKDPEAGSGQVSGRRVWVAEKKEYKYPDANVVICVPSTGQWQARTASSVAMTMADFIQGRLPGLRTAQIHLHTIESSMLSKNREEGVREMMRRGQTHILFVDSDMIVPADTLRRMLSHDLPFVAANCTTREWPPQPTAISESGERVASWGKTGLEKVRQVGLAVALIRRDVFTQTQPPHFLMDWVPAANSYCGEDIYFSQLLASIGVDVVIDHDLSNEVGHVGWTIFGQGQVGCQPPPDWRIE